MATTSEYLQTMQSQTGLQNLSVADAVAMLGGTGNPNSINWKDIALRAVTDPRIRSVQEYLDTLGINGDYKYTLEDFLNPLNAAAQAGLDAELYGIDQANDAYLRAIADNQNTAADTIRQLRAQAISQGIAKGMQDATLLSTLLGTSQQASEGAQQLAEQRIQAGKDYAQQLMQNQSSALNSSNEALLQLAGNIRQLYNDEIQRETAELEYNASANETNANVAANKYVADSNYSSGVLTNAANMVNASKSTLATLAAQAAAAAAQDNYSNAYQNAAQAAANATITAAGMNTKKEEETKITKAPIKPPLPAKNTSVSKIIGGNNNKNLTMVDLKM